MLPVLRANKLPAIQFYPGDWRKDVGVQSLSFHDRGVWFEMLLLMHESERRGFLVLNGRPMSDETIARALGLDKQILTLALTSLLESGVASREDETGAIYCRRMARDEKLRKVRSDAGKKGGNPLLLKQNPTTQVNQTLKMKMKKEDEESTSSFLSPEMVARGLCENIGISLGYGPQSVNTAVTEVAAAELKAGRDLEDVAVEMEAAWRFYTQEKPQLRIQWGPAKFFGEGHWRDPTTWPRKEKTRAQEITAWRAPDEAD